MNKEIKIIDLLNMIAEGKRVPEKIKYDTKEMKYDYNKQDYLGYYSNGNGEWLFQYLFDRCRNTKHFINDTVEIIEDKKVTYYNKDFMPVEEDNNKIEKLIIEQDGQTLNNFYLTNENGTKCYLTKHSKMIAEKINEIIDKINNL